MPQAKEHDGRYIPGKFSRHNRRSPRFDEYLRAQSSPRRVELMAAERAYVAGYADRLSSVEGPFEESMRGYSEQAAGPRAHEDQLLPLFAGKGDWSWQPQRYPEDSGYSFSPLELAMFNDGWAHYESDERRAELEAQMPTYRPPRHPRACPSCHLTACLGLDYHELADTQDFQQRARTPHRQAGDYSRHTHDYSIP